MAKRKKKKYKLNFFKIFLVLFCFGVLFTIGKDVFIRHFFNHRKTVIPNVVNLDKDDAVKYLKKAGLNVKVINSKSEEVPLNTVFIQFPEAGKTVKVNRTIQIWVNNGEGQEVPNVVGLELLEARSMLQGLNIEIEKIDYQASNEKYNTIISVYPKPGTKLEVNQKVSLLVSSQRVVDPSVMPNLIGLSLTDAKSLLQQTGLNLGNTTYGTDTTLPANTIIDTNPKPGNKIAPNQKISLVVNKAVEPKRTEPSVEDIINQTNKEIENREIENIINETLNKIDQKGSGSQSDNKQDNPSPSQEGGSGSSN